MKMALNLENKVALITGGGRGLGNTLALALAKEGADIIVASRRKKEFKRVVEEINHVGRKALAIPTNVSSPGSVRNMVEKTLREFNRIDILINNAGIGKVESILDHSDKLWFETISTNLTGTYLCTKAVLPEMVKEKSGRIINISSELGRHGQAGASAYSASKHGIVGFTECLALETISYGITANALCPTRIIREEGNTTLGVKENEIVSVVLYLCSKESEKINGQIIDIGWGNWETNKKIVQKDLICV